MTTMTTDEAVHRILVEIIPDLEHRIISDDTRLIDLGANSIDRAEIIMGCMESLGISGPIIEGAKCTTVGEVKEFLNARR
jgi:polyketide biosynthesis acyl carrier protein